MIEHLEGIGYGKGATQYKLRDAIFGRQRYWGEPIPVYYENGIAKTMPLEDLPLTLPDVDAYLPTEDGEPPLARANDWTYNGHPLETTTMPGWAGSSWYFLRYMDAHNNEEFAGRQPRSTGTRLIYMSAVLSTPQVTCSTHASGRNSYSIWASSALTSRLRSSSIKG